MPFFPRECGINMGFMGFKLLIRTSIFSDGCFTSPWLSTDESSVRSGQYLHFQSNPLSYRLMQIHWPEQMRSFQLKYIVNFYSL